MLLLLVLALVAGCLGGPEGRDGSGTAGDARGALGPEGSSRAGEQAAPAGPSRAQLQAEVRRVIALRAQAVRERDEELFAAQLGGGPRLRARQLRWFRSVSQLPWQQFDYELQDLDWSVTPLPRWGETYLVPRLTQRTRLDGFDDVAVERTVGLVFGFDTTGRARVVADRDGDGNVLVEGSPAPWELVATHVRRRRGVLGIFDDTTLASAPEVMSTVQRGIDEVDDALPFEWSRRVVVYAMADRQVLESFTDVPGGSVELLGALTFPVYSRPELSPVASTRMLLLPSSIAAGQPFLGRITRHELSHVAVGTRDDGAPTWFSEGLAEYLGARAVPAAERKIPTDAVRRAAGPVAALPSTRGFNGPDQDWHYALSWMTLDQLATTQGEDVLWRLLDAFGDEPVPDPDARTDQVLREVAGIGERRAARDGARRIRELYG